MKNNFKNEQLYWEGTKMDIINNYWGNPHEVEARNKGKEIFLKFKEECFG